MARSGWLILLLVLLQTMLPAGYAQAEDSFAKAVTDEGTLAYLSAALLLPLIRSDGEEQAQSLRTADALAVSYIVSTVLKDATDVERPDGSGDGSFPSRHAALGFAAAAVASEYEPDNAAGWYGGAALIGWSRVKLNRHRVGDVVAGAALGYGIAQLELGLPEGMLIAPFVDSDGGGLELRVSF